MKTIIPNWEREVLHNLEAALKPEPRSGLLWLIAAVLVIVPALPAGFLALTFDYSDLPAWRQTVEVAPLKEPTWSKPLRDYKVFIPPAPRSPYWKDRRIEWSI